MNIKNNQRTQNTQNKIKDVLIELLWEKDINKITIQEICRKADINRTTFYTHYNDIYDLMQKIEVEKMQMILTLLKNEDEKEPVLNVVNLEKLLVFILENMNFYKIYLKDFNINRTLNTLLCNDPCSEEVHQTKCDIFYKVEYLKAGLMGAILTWLNTGCQETPKEIAQILVQCIPSFDPQ